MNNQQQTEEDNAMIDRLVAQLNEAAWAEDQATQAHVDIVTNNVMRGGDIDDQHVLESEARVRDAQAAHQEAQAALAKKIRWFWYKGYRLCRDD